MTDSVSIPGRCSVKPDMILDKFTNKGKHPSEADLRKRIGPPYHLIEDTITLLESEYRGISTEWKFYKTSGWYVTCDKGKKRLFYLVPADGDFVFKMVFNDKCLEQIKDGSFPKFILEMIREAKRYPEGTLLVFDRSTFRIETILKLLRIKIEN